MNSQTKNFHSVRDSEQKKDFELNWPLTFYLVDDDCHVLYLKCAEVFLLNFSSFNLYFLYKYRLSTSTFSYSSFWLFYNLLKGFSPTLYLYLKEYYQTHRSLKQERDSGTLRHLNTLQCLHYSTFLTPRKTANTFGVRRQFSLAFQWNPLCSQASPGKFIPNSDFFL